MAERMSVSPEDRLKLLQNLRPLAEDIELLLRTQMPHDRESIDALIRLRTVVATLDYDALTCETVRTVTIKEFAKAAKAVPLRAFGRAFSYRWFGDRCGSVISVLGGTHAFPPFGPPESITKNKDRLAWEKAENHRVAKLVQADERRFVASFARGEAADAAA